MSVGWELVRLGFKERMQYRLDFLLNIILVPFTFLAFYFIWKSLFEHNAVSTIQGFTFNETITYFAISIIVNWATGTWITELVGKTIVRGDFARYIIFPIDFYKYNLLRQVGDKIPGNIIRLPFFFLLFVIFFNIKVNTNILQLLLFFTSLVLGFLLLNTFNYLFSLLAFWEEAFWTISMISHSIIGFFSGSIIPLDFYPESIRWLVELLPFKHMSYSPIMIYLGRLSVAESLLVFANQLFFTIVFYLLARLLFRIGRGKFTSQGG